MKLTFTLAITIFLSSAISYSQTHETGEINGAEFEIIVPENWNKGLVMYAHGYEETDKFSVEDEGLEAKEEETEDAHGEEFYRVFTSRGYAFAASDD